MRQAHLPPQLALQVGELLLLVIDSFICACQHLSQAAVPGLGRSLATTANLGCSTLHLTLPPTSGTSFAASGLSLRCSLPAGKHCRASEVFV